MTSSEPRLRSVIATGEGDNVVWWPLGQSDTFRERIPIHRTPDLAPHAAPPILEDIPTDFALPEAAEPSRPHARKSTRLDEACASARAIAHQEGEW